ncbi:sulfite exporter TauE/SafE family protein [Streptomyces sp. NPDC016459]|uniref:HoxN/HupN/NixA family nickel/cobalt transporter n=1 Tax=Streptomyces sp. NPDC016459 TaxID=3157190 RepID=UPI0033E3539D
MIPTLLRATAGASTALLIAAIGTPVASAHPLGNFTVNHHTGLVLHPDRVDVRLVIDRAEIAAMQELPAIDSDRDGKIATQESAAYARKSCATLATQLHATADGVPLRWAPVTAAALTHHPGEAGLKTSRLQCTLTAPADLRAPAHVELRTSYDTRRIGWQEITARGDGVQLLDADVPARSSTDELRRYPEDPLATPLEQRTATLRTAPGNDGPIAVTRSATDGAGPLGTVLGKISSTFESVVGSRELTVPVGLLALVLAIVLGASHAALPGHGKTLMAAYLAGRRGTPRDAVTVGATVTLTHTGGVLILGLALPLATHLAGETILTWLGITSGLLVTGIGLWLLRSALSHKNTGHHHGHGHHHHGHSHSHSHGHHHHHHHGHHHGEHDPAPVVPDSRRPHTENDQGSPVALLTRQDDEHAHAHAHDHSHAPEPEPARTTRGGLIGMGVAGGLVPSPSALVVLLGAIALGRTAFGVLLVLAYGLGMAATLTLAGLLLVRLRDRVEAGLKAAAADRWKRVRSLARYAPVGTSALVLAVGLGLTARAAMGPW